MFECLHYIDEKGPKAFVLENVHGFVLQHRTDFDEVLRRLENANSGYDVKWKIMDTLYHGLPQSRPRVYIVGIKKENLKVPSQNKAKDCNIDRILSPKDAKPKRKLSEAARNANG